MRTSRVEACGPPPKTRGMAKLERQRENTTAKVYLIWDQSWGRITFKKVSPREAPITFVTAPQLSSSSLYFSPIQIVEMPALRKTWPMTIPQRPYGKFLNVKRRHKTTRTEDIILGRSKIHRRGFLR